MSLPMNDLPDDEVDFVGEQWWDKWTPPKNVLLWWTFQHFIVVKVVTQSSNCSFEFFCGKQRVKCLSYFSISTAMDSSAVDVSDINFDEDISQDNSATQSTTAAAKDSAIELGNISMTWVLVLTGSSSTGSSKEPRIMWLCSFEQPSSIWDCQIWQEDCLQGHDRLQGSMWFRLLFALAYSLSVCTRHTVCQYVHVIWSVSMYTSWSIIDWCSKGAFLFFDDHWIQPLVDEMWKYRI